MDKVLKFVHDVDAPAIVLRLFHENTGSFFWWGLSTCTAVQYKAAYNYTVQYLRAGSAAYPGIHSAVWAYAPAKPSQHVNASGYGVADPDGISDGRYPGDTIIDVACFDNYGGGSPGDVAAWTQVRKTPHAGPEVGSTSVFCSCFPTGTHGPTCFFLVSLTPFLVSEPDRGRGPDCKVRGEPGRYCHSTLSLAVIGCHSLGIYTAILRSLLSFSVRNDSVVPSKVCSAPRQGLRHLRVWLQEGPE
jgi:hypothetical protein